MLIRYRWYENWLIVVVFGIPIGSFAFQSYILITQVFMSKDDDLPLSSGLEIAAFVVYGVTVAAIVILVVVVYFEAIEQVIH